MAIYKPHSPRFPLYNKNHPLARGLVFGAIPGGQHRQDIVTGNFPSDINTGSFHGRRSKLGSVWDSQSNSDGGIIYPLTNEIQSIADTNAITIMAFAEFDAVSSFFATIGVPYRNTGSWSIPWLSFVLNQDASSGDGSFNKAYSSSARWNTDSSGGGSGTFYGTTFPTPMLQYVVTNKVADVNWYKDGKFWSNETLGGSQTFDFASASELCLTQRASDVTGEAYDGGCGPSFVWNRALSVSEIAQINGDPFIFIRQPLIHNVITTPAAFEVSLSSNIATGGADTTAQLTAPATKTTGDFDTGRIWDDENGADTIDITVDNYTELEWCLQATALSEEVSYDFRVVKNDGTVLDTYTVTPQLTVSLVADLDVDETVTLGESLTFDISQAHAEAINFTSIGTDIIDEKFTTPAGWDESGTVTQTGGDATATSSTSAGATLTETFTAGSEFWADIDVSLDSGFVITNNGHSSHMCALLDSTLRLCALTALKSGGNIIFRANYQGDGSSVNVPITTPASITLGQVYKVRMHVKQNSGVDVADGVREMWIDGVKVLDVSDVDDDTRQVDGFRIGNITPSSTVNGTSRFDNAKVGTTGPVGDALTLDIDQAHAETITAGEALDNNTSQALTETIATNESLAESISKELSETVTTTEAIGYDIGFAETVSVTDSLATSFAQVYDETVSIGEALDITINQAFAETITTNEALTEAVSKELAETITIGEEVDIPLPDLDVDETISLSESLAFVINQGLAETITTNEALTEAVSKELSETITINEDLDTPLSINPDETISLSESLALDISQAHAETVTTSEALTEAISQPLSETITIGEALATPLDLGLNETISLSESLAFVINQGLAETITISELLGIPVDLDADETITIGEALAETVSKELAETITISEALSYDVSRDETISLSDSLVLDINQVISESITVTEALTEVISTELSETITIGDEVSTPEGLNPADTITIVEALVNDVDKELAETLSLSEVLVLNISQALAEAVDINDILVSDSGVFNPAEERILLTTTEDRILLTTTEDRILLTTTEDRILEVE
jgi:hypothetical protein